MKIKESEKETLGVLPVDKYLFLEDLNFSDKPPLNSKLIKNNINCAIFNAIDLGRPESEIETLVNAGDIIDSISNQLMEGGS